jgi:hypothetical protein
METLGFSKWRYHLGKGTTVRNEMRVLGVTWICAAAALGAAPQAASSVDSACGVEIDQIQVACRIEGRQLAVSPSFEARTKQASCGTVLVQGNAVLDKLDPAMGDARLDYDPNDRAYRIVWRQPGLHRVDATFIARGDAEPNSLWQRASLRLPAGRVRLIRLLSDQPDLEVDLPGALRVLRRIEQGQLIVEATLGPRSPLEIRWKPQVQLADARLVLSGQANTVVDVRAGLMQIDSLLDFQIAQGKLDTLTFNVPAGLSVTAVRGLSIRTWGLGEAVDGVRPLRLEMSRAQDREYRLHILAESAIDSLPATVQIPVIEPTGDLRISGQLAVGTDSALQLVVQESSGLTQVDAAAFPRVPTQDGPSRSIPQGKAFFYTYAGSRYRLGLLIDDIVPTFEVAARVIAGVKEDDLVIDAELELDVRDAPLRQLEIAAPASLVVAAVDGNQVGDYHLSEAPAAGGATSIRVVFKEPVVGRTLLRLRLELGRGPLGEPQSIPALCVMGAKVQRGYVVVAAEPGIEIDPPQAQNLREIHTASAPLRVPGAQYAYRFREADWGLGLLARRRPAEIRAEVFHLESIGEALAHGSAVINYIITGSPVDELRFRLPASFENVEFVGRDVRRWVRQDETWVVKLNQKVLGDYSLAVTYTQRYGPDRPIQLGTLHCLEVQTQTGYAVVTSHLDLRLQLQDPAPLLAIALDELPGDYRLLTSGPILAVYKYIAEPHAATLTVEPYQRSELLPVVVDIAGLQSTLAVRPDGRIESVTIVRYKVKNTTGQFLALRMPPDARVWAVSQIEASSDGMEQATRLAASHDQDSGRLLIPLRRQANPNDPATLVLEYGQVHAPGTWWKRNVELAAPGCTVPIAYADWQIVVPDRWAVAPAGGNMQVQPRPEACLGLAGLVGRVVRSWDEALDRVPEDQMLWAFVGVMGILVAVGMAVWRRNVPDLIVLTVLGTAVWIGIKAWMADPTFVASLTSIRYAQAVSADPDQALHVSVGLVPAWRQALRVSDAIVAAAIVVVGVGLAIRWRRLRRIALAAAAAALVYLAAELPAAWPLLKAMMTWLTPAVAAVWFAYRTWRQRPVLAQVAAVAAILLAGGCSSTASAREANAGRSLIERLECSLSAGTDNMELKYSLRVRTDRASRFPLLDESAVLVSPVKPGNHLRLVSESGRHVLHVEEPGVYQVEAVFLTALPPAGEDQQRRFELALPVALTNRISLVIPDANVSVEAPQAVSLAVRQEDRRTCVEAMFTPGQPATFTWRPLERQAAREEVRFYARDLALANVTPGLLQVFHEIRLRIAQGQVDRLTLDVASGQTVTSVVGQWIGAWRFDPVGKRLEVRLGRPAAGSYAMTVVTQSANAAVPYDVHLEPLVVEQALDQHSVVGIAAEPSVYVLVDRHPAAMNVADYIAEAAELVKAVPGIAVGQINQAFRFENADSAVTGRVQAVQSEIRSRETARFNVEDDRLVYNSQWEIEIAKAGRFDVDLLMPEGFDVDALEAQEVSHWDDSVEANQRRIRVHFKRRLTGSVHLKLALSRAVAEVPDRLAAPRVTVMGGIKHVGCLVVGSEQGVRVSVASRQGVSEVNPVELGHSGQGLLAFQFLRPDWEIQLQTELVQARVTVQSLHVAKVTDGLVRHQHALRYRLYHAGTKAFSLALPADAIGVAIAGPGIARREQSNPGQWRIELADKVYDQPYLMNVTYETRYDPADGNVPLAPIRCEDADLQQGHVAVFATDRVELATASTDAALRPADARSIPDYFGAGDLSGAAMCYRSISPQYALTVQAKRHTAAGQIDAEVLRTDLVSVVTAAGQTINHAMLVLRVNGRRHLQAILPDGADVWSLSVEGQAVQPSLRTASDGRGVLLVPLPQQASGDVLMDMVYVADLPGAGPGWSGRHALQGPRFDLPLKSITWRVYVPQGFGYSDFGGTLSVDSHAVQTGNVRSYGLQTYHERLVELNRENEQVAQQQQTLARTLAEKGEQDAARQALTKGYNFSFGNSALNEDIRVDLDNLVRQQAKVGLINARGRLRQQSGAAPDSQVSNVVQMPAQGFSQQQAQRIENSIGQADNENLDLITRRIIQTQAAAETSVSQIQVTMPICGQVLHFESPLQVEPTAEMMVSFTAKPQQLAQVDPSLWHAFGVFAVVAISGAVVHWIRGPWSRLRAVCARRPARIPAPTKSEDRDDRNRQVSAEELL